MVNIAKRMRHLKPALLSVRNGAGAALLPPPPAPQLTKVHLRFPYGPFSDEVHGIRSFWREHLRRLKFHNPALPVEVQHEEGTLGSPMYLRLVFESEDPEALRAIAQKSQKPREIPRRLPPQQKPEEVSVQEQERLAQGQSPNWRDQQPEKKRELSQEEVVQAENGRPSADDDEVVLKPQPAADPSRPSSTSPPKQVYQRSVTLGLKGRTASQIWTWFKYRTRCVDVPESEEDKAERDALATFGGKAEFDRRRVKAGVEALKKEKEDLKRARGEADQLKLEV